MKKTRRVIGVYKMKDRILSTGEMSYTFHKLYEGDDTSHLISKKEYKKLSGRPTGYMPILSSLSDWVVEDIRVSVIESV